jgi:hypothetical protein
LLRLSGTNKFVPFPYQQFSQNLPVVDPKSPQADWELESARAGAAGIEVEHSVSLFHFGLVAVAVNDGAESGSFRLQVELREIVEEVDEDATDFYDFGSGQFAAPGFGIHVAANRGDGSDATERVEDLASADVAGVKNVVTATQGFDGFVAKQAVRIGNDAENHAVSFRF